MKKVLSCLVLVLFVGCGSQKGRSGAGNVGSGGGANSSSCRWRLQAGESKELSAHKAGLILINCEKGREELAEQLVLLD